ncbi:MAG TPA: hypothetical protein EYP36_08910 [Calditrichaeota bacterium]|nr:hypothetical protein [Calditrichota bacterium]
MKRKIIFFALTAFLFVVGCSQTEEQNITDPGKTDVTVAAELFSPGDLKIQTVISNLNILARNLAFALKDQAVINALSVETRKADNRERIIDLNKWLVKGINGQTLAERMALSGRLEHIDGRQRQITADDFIMLTESLKPMVDVYFPVDEHRANWYENRDKLRIAVVHPAREWDPATAYTLDGQTVELDPYTPPKEPALVVSLCEHGGGSDGDGYRNHPRQNGDEEYLYKGRQRVCEEGYFLGDPEIYVDIFTQSGSKIKRYWFTGIDCEYT